MKGFNVKRLAAIATGAALLGSAIAPVVSATNVTKDDIYGANGSPAVNIVVGSQAAVSDAVWAGNLAAKIAEKAATVKTVKTTATGENGEEVGADLDLSDMTIDVSLGGKVSFGAGSKTYSVSLSSGTNAPEVIAAINGTDDANALTDAQLPHLYNKTITEKVTNGDQSNQRNSLTVRERIGVEVDAKFDTAGTDTKDLTAKIDASGFMYEVTVGSSTTGVDLGSTSFSDSGSDDDVKLAFFGEEYQLDQATLTGTKYVKIVKASAKESYNEGETIEGLVGTGAYDGEDMSVKVVQVVQTGAATTTYSATFELYDAEGNLVDTQTVATAANLKDSFVDSDGEEALQSNLYVNTIVVGSTTGLGYVEITKGTDTVELYDNGVYPYDSSHTGSKKYIASITAGSSDANSLYSIQIKNQAEIWDDPETGGFDLGPLYPTRSGQSLTGMSGTTATFLQSLPDDTQGKGYATVEFLGFEGDEEKTTVEISKTVATGGGITFRDDDDVVRTIPFYIKLPDANGSFTFEGKTISYNMDFGSGGKTGTADTNVVVSTGDYVNGRVWTIATGADTNATITVTGMPVLSTDGNVNLGETFVVDGTTYTLRNANNGTNQVSVAVDEVVDFRFGDSDSSTYMFNTSGDTTDASYGKLALTNSSTFDANVGTIGLYGHTSTKPVYYAAQYNASDLWLLLDADVLGATDNAIQNSHAVTFLGTSVPNNDGTYTEAAGVLGSFSAGTTQILGASPLTEIQKVGSVWNYGHYVPKNSDFNNATIFSASEAFFVAEFQVNSNVDGAGADFNVYVDTSDGGLIGPFPSTNLSSYADDVKYLQTTTWTLRSGTQSTYMQAGYTDAGSKAWLIDGTDTGAKISMPQNAEKVEIVVSGTEVERTVSGGDTLTLKDGETGTTDSGTEVTVVVNGGSCVATGGSGSAICTANPATYASPAPVDNPLVYLDTEAPTGTNIIVGGHIVNSLARGLADRLTAPGDMVAEVGASGDIYVAGYTADDTGKAVQELIDDIDGWELA